MYILLCGYPPFNGNNDLQIFKAILKQDLIFDEEDWKEVSQEARSLVKSLLHKFPSQRISMQEVLSHPWFQKNFQPQENNKGAQILAKLKNFRIKGKLELALRIYLVQFCELEEQQQELLQFFKRLDKNHDGMINKEELLEGCASFKVFFDVEQFLELVDINNDHEINYSEFLMTAFDFQKNLSQQNVRQIFDQVDSDHSGTIDIEELRVFLNVGEDSTLLGQILNEVDSNSDGVI